MNDTATCATVSRVRNQWAPPVSVVCAPPSFSAVATLAHADHAGTMPNASPVATDNPSVKASTQPSSAIWLVRGVSKPANDTSRSRPAQASTSPSTPPTRASSVVSVSSCARRRPRPAPSADRSASSRSRPNIRASVRLATLAQAINSTRGSGAQQNQQHRTGVAGQLLAERRGDGGVAGVGLIDLGEVLLEPAGHRGQVGAELLDGHPGPQPAERGHAPEGGAVLVHACFAARPERTGRRRHVDVVVSWILRDRGQHPDHRVGLVVHLEHGAHDVWVATEALLPVGVAQHQHRFGAQVVVGVDERAAEQRLHAKHGEKVGRHHPGQHPVRLTAVQERERHAVILDEAVQRLQLVAVVDDLLDRERNVLGAGAGCLLAREHQLVPVAVGQRLQQHAVDNAEDRGVGADAERQGHDHQQAVARAAPQRADAVSDVLGEAVPNARPVAGRRLCVTHARIISCTTGREQSRVCAG